MDLVVVTVVTMRCGGGAGGCLVGFDIVVVVGGVEVVVLFCSAGVLMVLGLWFLVMFVAYNKLFRRWLLAMGRWTEGVLALVFLSCHA